MADFYPPGRVEQPDIMGQYVRGQLMPGMVQGQQQQLAIGGQQVEAGQLNLNQLRQMMALRQGLYNNLLQPQPGTQTNGAQDIGGASGGIQNGPQGSVSSQPPQGIPSVPDVKPLPYSAGTIQAVSLLAPDLAKGMSEGQAMQRQQQQDAINRVKLYLQPKVDELENLRTSPNPEKLVMANPAYMEGARRYLAKMGLDPNDPRNYTPENIRTATTIAHNDLAGASYGTIAPLPMPEQWRQQDVGYGGTQQVNAVTGERKPGLPREIPTATQEKVYDPQTGRETLRSIPTGGMTAGGQPIALGGGSAGTPGAPPSPQRDLGAGKPSTENLKAAQFANYMIPALDSLKKMEASGYALPPASRAAIINAATSEDTGALSSIMQQEMLKHGLGQQGQAYMAALMPVLQAAGHAMGGARLTAGQMRANFESLIPVDSSNASAMQSINQNRESYLRGLVGESGSAAQTPAFKGTVGALAEQYRNAGRGPPKIGDVIKGHKYIGGPPNAKSSWEAVGG